MSGRPLADDITYVQPGAEAPRGGYVLPSRTRARHQGELQVIRVGKLFGPASEDGKICLSLLSTFQQIMLEAINAPALYVATQSVLSLLASRRTPAIMMHDELRVSYREGLRSTRRCLCALRDARPASCCRGRNLFSNLYRKLWKFHRCGSLTEPLTYQSCCKDWCLVSILCRKHLTFCRCGSLTEPPKYQSCCRGRCLNFNLVWKIVGIPQVRFVD